MRKVKRIILSAIITLVIVAVGFYITLPPLNVHSTEFWSFLIFAVIVFGISNFILSFGIKGVGEKMGHTPINFKSNKFAIGIVIAALIPVIVIFLGNISSSTFFNARAYANIITVENAVFELCKMGVNKANIYVAIGPCVDECCYEVGSDFANQIFESAKREDK